MVKHNDAGGSLTVKEAVITSVKIVVIIGVLYVLIYIVSVALFYAGVRVFADLF